MTPIFYRVTLARCAPEVSYLLPVRATCKGLPVAKYVVGTNGLVYQQLIADLPAGVDQYLWLPFLPMRG